VSYQDSYDRPQTPLAMPRITPVVRWLMIANLAIWGLETLLYFSAEGALAGFVDFFGLTPRWWANFWFPVWQVVSYGFLHAPRELGHVFFNMLTLYFFGTMLEGVVGSRRFAVFYALALVVGALAHMLAELTWGSATPAIGASGATMAVLIAMAVMRPNLHVILLLFPIKLKYLAGAFVLMDVLRLGDDLKSGSGNVAYMVHLGGAALGFLAVKRGWIWRDPIEDHQRRAALKARERGARDDERMDELLAKIHREGMSALSRQEREFLRRMSKH